MLQFRQVENPAIRATPFEHLTGEAKTMTTEGFTVSHARDAHFEPALVFSTAILASKWRPGTGRRT
jgi:hypothetical protein